MRMLDNFEEWSRVSVSCKGAKRMERKAMIGCGWLGRGEVQGRSLSLEYIPTQWRLARRRRGKEYNVHYDRNEEQW